MQFCYFIEKHIRSNSKSADDACEIYHDAIVIFDRQVRARKFLEQSTIKTYLLGICKNLWLKKLSRRKEVLQTVDIDKEELDTLNFKSEESNYEIEKDELVKELLKKLDEACQRILNFYSIGYSMKQISKIMNFASEDVAKAQKYRCKKKLMQFAVAHPFFKNKQY